MEPDFGGYVTKAGLKCSDGRTIMPDAFKHMDGQMVPLVWQHGHDSPDNVLGHVMLEHREDGVYGYGFFNNTKQGQNCKLLVQHKDLNSLSIYANRLVERTKQVFHGFIRETSLVIAGANPGAKIDFVAVQHGDGLIENLEDEAIIWTGLNLEHADPATPEVEDAKDEDEEVDEDDENLDDVEHADGDQETVEDVYETLTPKQKSVVEYLIAVSVENESGNKAEHSDDNADESDLAHKEGTTVSRNIFEGKDGTGTSEDKHVLSHTEMAEIFKNAPKLGSLKDSVTSYALAHGIESIDVLFPDAKNITNTPEFDKRRTEWVAAVLNGTRHTPFSRIKTVWADITQDEARAKGYIKGSYKNEEWFGISRRTTSPTTIYKKQALDRDDVLDITDMDVVMFMKGEMRLMLEEEIARAILIGDGRDVSHEDKIKDPIGAAEGTGIRSILNDHEYFVTTLYVNTDDANSSYEEVVDAVIDGMEFYKGTGTPTFFTTIRHLNSFLKAKDGNERRYYANKSEVAQALGVKDVIPVEPMNGDSTLIGIIVNLEDYNIGTDQGGEINLFDDFDIDYNKLKYLMETRMSGALTKLKSALVIRKTTSTNTLVVPNSPTFVDSTGVTTIVATTGVVYKNADTDATLSTGAQTALAEGATLRVKATPASGYYIANNNQYKWTFKRPAA